MVLSLQLQDIIVKLLAVLGELDIICLEAFVLVQNVEHSLGVSLVEVNVDFVETVLQDSGHALLFDESFAEGFGVRLMLAWSCHRVWGSDRSGSAQGLDPGEELLVSRKMFDALFCLLLFWWSHSLLSWWRHNAFFCWRHIRVSLLHVVVWFEHEWLL